MPPVFCHGLLILSLLLPVFATEIEFHHCNCEGDIFKWQKASDFLIAAAYFSIPLELFYFVTCSNVFPFKWVLFQFGAFIVLCGLTHLLNVFSYEPHSFLLMLSLTISKFLTALVSFLTAITLLTLIPQLLRVKVRENFLRLKARELDREVGLMKRQEEASWHVRMLTHEIRKSLDRHTILYTTLVELSKTLKLQNCAVWMPNEDKTVMNLTHELRGRSSLDVGRISVDFNDPDIIEVRRFEGVKRLAPNSVLGSKSSGGMRDGDAVAAIRMPMLKVSDFKCGTPEVIHTCYAILVLVLPKSGSQNWGPHELEIVEVVADQVAVALSHAAVLEESQLMRDRLAEQNRVLLWAKQNAVLANEARNAFQRVMSQGMRRPIHSIMGLLSMLQEENLSPQQRLTINTMVRAGNVASTLINDVMDISANSRQLFALEMRRFRLHSLIKEAATAARCLCDFRGFGFVVQVENVVPDQVVGDERRIFHVILHMVGNVLHGCDEGYVTLRVHTDDETEDSQGQRWVPRKPNFSGGYALVKFELGIKKSQSFHSSSSSQLAQQPNSVEFDMGLSFSMCKKLVQLMQGNIWVIPNPQGLPETMTLVLRFQLPSRAITTTGGSLEHHHLSHSLLTKGLKVLLADDDDVNRAVTQKLLEKLGCRVSTLSSGLKSVSSLVASCMAFELVILDPNISKVNSFELAVRIQTLRSGCWPLMIALTAGLEDNMWEKCLQSGIDGLIRKPVVLQVLKEELNRVLQNQTTYS